MLSRHVGEWQIGRWQGAVQDHIMYQLYHTSWIRDVTEFLTAQNIIHEPTNWSAYFRYSTGMTTNKNISTEWKNAVPIKLVKNNRLTKKNPCNWSLKEAIINKHGPLSNLNPNNKTPSFYNPFYTCSINMTDVFLSILQYNLPVSTERVSTLHGILIVLVRRKDQDFVHNDTNITITKLSMLFFLW